MVDRLARVVLAQDGLVIHQTMHHTDASPCRLSSPRNGFLTSTGIRGGRILLSTLTVCGGRIYRRGTHSLEPGRVVCCLMLLDDLGTSAVLAFHEIVLQPF